MEMQHTLFILGFLAILRTAVTATAAASDCLSLQCSYECVKSQGGSFCQCPEGQFMKKDRQTCAPRQSDPKDVVVFCVTWPNGAQGKIYFPTGVDTVLVTFPHAVERINVWHGSVFSKVSDKRYIITQSEIERQASPGLAKFVLSMGSKRFPDYDVVVTPSE